MIRKIKIDKILGRQSSEINGTEYLNEIKEEPKDIFYIDDLFISSLIFDKTQDPSFTKHSTLKKIIEF